MTIETAYAALAALLENALRGTAFLDQAQLLEIDPEAPFAPSGDETGIIRAAALVKVRTAAARRTLGRPALSPRYVVERECRLELAIAGPNRGVRLEIARETLAVLAQLPDLHPTLGGEAERFMLGEQTDDELPPNGVATFISFTLRVRSSDPLGQS